MRCTFELRTPDVPESGPARPGTRFEAARVGGARCEAAPPAAAGDAASATHARLAARQADSPHLHLQLTVPAACEAALTEGARGAPLELAPASLLPQGAWLHLAGDSLLRNQFTTLAQYIGNRSWERWQGAACARACAQRWRLRLRLRR